MELMQGDDEKPWELSLDVPTDANDLEFWDDLFPKSEVYSNKVETKVCTCGVWSTYGKSYPADKHPDYCDLRRK